MSSPLLVVTLVLRHQKEGATLDQLGHLVADYLGPDRNLSLSAACKFGSTTLLDWIWGHSPTSTTNRSPQWLLTNYLRSDLHYYQYQFQQSVLVAVKKGDLRVLEWLMEHFSGCEVPVAAVETAAELGRLDMLQFLVKHDAGRRDEEVPSRKKRKVDTEASNGELGGGNVVHWGGYSLVQAASKKHFDIIRFLHDNTLHDVYTNTLDETIGLALECGEMGLVETLLPPGKSAIDYGQGSSNPAMIELTFDAGLLDDKLLAATALNRLVASGSLDLMKKIWEKHENLTSSGGWMNEWMEAMATACLMGNLAILQWMVEHNSGRAAITHSKQQYNSRVSLLLYYATAAGRLDAMQYLHQQGAGVDYGNALLCAIRRDRMDAVKWLLAHFPPLERIPEHCVLVEAARNGRIEMLEYFQSAEELKVPGFPGSVAFSIPQAGTQFSFKILAAAAKSYVKPNHLRWLPTDAMDDAAANGQLAAVQWLHTNRSEGCTTLAMNEAAAKGHLQVVKWLLANRSEGYTDHGMAIAAAQRHEEVVKFLVVHSLTKVTDIIVQNAVERGQFALVKWLHAQSGARFTVKMLTKAAGGGHLEVLKYVYLHRSKGFTLKSCAAIIREALAYGHFRVAYWCARRFPVHSPKPVMITTATVFESLLFVQFHYPESFLPAKLRRRMGSFTVFGAVAKWLDAQIS